MKSPPANELQRLSLRLHLQANRLLLEESLLPRSTINDDCFPRSLTMRILTNTKGLGTFLIAEVTPFLVGLYLEKRKQRMS